MSKQAIYLQRSSPPAPAGSQRSACLEASRVAFSRDPAPASRRFQVDWCQAVASCALPSSSPKFFCAERSRRVYAAAVPAVSRASSAPGLAAFCRQKSLRPSHKFLFYRSLPASFGGSSGWCRKCWFPGSLFAEESREPGFGRRLDGARSEEAALSSRVCVREIIFGAMEEAGKRVSSFCLKRFWFLRKVFPHAGCFCPDIVFSAPGARRLAVLLFCRSGSQEPVS